MGQLVDMTGQRFGRLEVLERAMPPEGKKANYAQWRCRCDCGVIKVINGSNLRTGKSTSCGCLQKDMRREAAKKRAEQKAQEAKAQGQAAGRRPQKDLSGKTFGLLTVLREGQMPVHSLHTLRTTWWVCRCKCGKEVIKSAEYLRASKKASCGCAVEKTVRSGCQSREQMGKQKPADMSTKPVVYNTHTCPQCGKTFETYGCGWGYKLNGELYCRWSCLRAAEREQTDKTRKEDRA